ncbi:hypothetical protein FACS189419_09790 [Planctomycetales bacterium]|nr:hypothetical protein FACS189419_09790 [Planctomycetales bacterium]
MSVLQIQNFPNELFEAVSGIAQKKHLSFEQQIIAVVERGLKEELVPNVEANRKRRRDVWKRIQANEIPETVKSIDYVKEMREDRNR